MQMSMSKPVGPVGHGDRHSPRPAEGPDSAGAARRAARAGRAAIRSQHPPSRRRGHRRSLPGAGAASSHPDSCAASGPEPGTWKDPGPRRRSGRGPGAQNRPARAAIVATRRLRPVPSQRFLALRCRARTPSCSRQVTPASISMVNPSPASAPRGHAPLRTDTLSLARTISDRCRIFYGYRGWPRKNVSHR